MQRRDLKTFFSKLTASRHELVVDDDLQSSISTGAAAEATSLYYLPMRREKETLHRLNNKCFCYRETIRRIDISVRISSAQFSAKCNIKSNVRHASREKILSLANCPFFVQPVIILGLISTCRYDTLWRHPLSFVHRCGRKIFTARTS